MRIFLGAPFSGFLNGKQFNSEYKELLNSIIISLEKKGHVVKSAHVREKFGGALMTPDVCTPLDLDEIKSCDLFIAIPSHPTSGGVHIELGWASALGKQILLCMKDNAEYSPLVHGLHKVSDVRKLTFDNHSELPEKISQFVE